MKHDDRRRCISGQIVLAGRCQRTNMNEYTRQGLGLSTAFCGDAVLLAEMDKKASAHAPLFSGADFSTFAG